MRGRCALFGALLLLLLARPALAQESALVTDLTVTLQPQYDDPRLRLLLELTLDRPGSALVAIPPAVELRGASYVDGTGTLQPMAATFEARSEGRYIRVDSPTRAARLELYQDAIPPGPARALELSLPPQPGALASLVWRAALPGDATEIRTEPAMEVAGSDHFGMQLFERAAGPLPAGERATQRIEWVRASDEPVFAPAAPPATAPEVPAPADRGRVNLLLGVLFALGLGLVLHGLWQARRAAA